MRYTYEWLLPLAVVVCLSFAVCVCVVKAQSVEPKKLPELIVDVDINDEVWLRGHTMTEGDVSELVLKLKQNGCRTMMIRCGCLGHLPYRTKLSYSVEAFDPDDVRANPAPGIIKDVEQYIAQRTPWQKRYADVIRVFNPPEVFIREAHKHGMKAIIWLDIFDDYFPGYCSKFLAENPHCQWVSKDGKTYFKGLTDYAWPEARAFRVAQAQELLDLGADGIHCSSSAHCRHLPNTHETDFYGYSQPVVDAFKEKYGVDIRTAESFDKVAWHDLKGDMMVRLYSELAALCHGRGKELWIGLQLGRRTHFSADPYFSSNVVARYSNHWRRLVDEKIADAFVLGDFEIMSLPEHAYWKAKDDIQPRPSEDLFAWAAREYQSHCRGKTRLYLFSEWLPHDPSGLVKRLKFWAESTCANRFDGIDVHEAWNLQSHPGNMEELGKMAERMRTCVATPSCCGEKAVKFVAFGDSTTAPRGALQVYADCLKSELPKKGIQAEIINAGVGGNTTVAAKARFEKDVLARHPDIVVIQFGINDSAVDVWNKPPATEPRVKKQQYTENLGYFVDRLRERGCLVILMTPNPLRWTPGLKGQYGKPPYRPDRADGFNVTLSPYADCVRAVAKKKRVALVDVYAAFEAYGKVKGQSVDDLLLDGMHPNDKGQRLVAELLIATVLKLDAEGTLLPTKTQRESGGAE